MPRICPTFVDIFFRQLARALHWPLQRQQVPHNPIFCKRIVYICELNVDWLPYVMAGSVIFVKYMVLWAMIYNLASVQLCDALFSYTMEIDKYAAECAHCCVYYLLSSNACPESAWFLSESRTQITTVSISISSTWGCRKQVLPPSPTLTGTTDAPKCRPYVSYVQMGPWLHLWWLDSRRSLSAEPAIGVFREMVANGASECANREKFDTKSIQ